MQQQLQRVKASDPLFESPFFKERKKLYGLLRSLYDGFELDYDVLERLRTLSGATGVMNDVLADVGFRTDRPFDFDSQFTNQRFYLMTAWTRALPSDGFLMAGGQVERLYLTGRVDPQYVSHMVDKAIYSRKFDLAAMMLAHDDLLRPIFCGLQFGRSGQANEYARRIVAKAEMLREIYFHERWLPALISADEYQQAQQLAPSLSRALYPAEWQAGYLGYQRSIGVPTA